MFRATKLTHNFQDSCAIKKTHFIFLDVCHEPIDTNDQRPKFDFLPDLIGVFEAD